MSVATCEHCNDYIDTDLYPGNWLDLKFYCERCWEELTIVTFGQAHRHEIGGQVFDKDCVALVHGDRSEVFRLFGRQWCFEYPVDQWDETKLAYYPRGYVEVRG